MKRTVFLAIAFLVTIFFIENSFSQAREARGVTDRSIKIGLIVAMTCPAASLGGVGAEAIKTYIRYVNDRGGVNGRQLNLLIEDDRYAIPPPTKKSNYKIFEEKTGFYLIIEV